MGEAKRRFGTAPTTNEALLEILLDWQRDYYKKNPKGMMRPTLTAVTPAGIVMIVPDSFDEPDKQVFCQIARVKLKQMGAIRYGFFSEAWVAGAMTLAEFDERPPSQRDDRVEVIVTVVADHESKLMRLSEIVRDWRTGAVTSLKPSDAYDESPDNPNAEVAGRMAFLLD